MDIERELGVGPTADKREIRRAYARRLKQTHPEDDPEGFRRLREAYEAALNYAEYMAEEEVPLPDAPQASRGSEHEEAAKGEDSTVPLPAAPAPPQTENAAPDTPRDDGEGRKRAADLAAVNQLTRRLASRLDEQDEEAAAGELESALSNPLLMNLRNRRHFELLLLEEIGERDPLPWTVAKEAIQAFRWDEHWTDLPPDYQYLADCVLSVPLTEERLARLRQDAKRMLTRDYGKAAARMLLGPYRPLMFNIAAGADMLEAMGALLAELRAGYPMILQRDVDPRVLHWWTEATSDSVARINRRTSRLTWVVIGVSFALGLVQTLLNR